MPLKITKGDIWRLRETGGAVVVTHASLLSVGWREDGQTSTFHTSRNQFLNDYSRPRLLISSNYIERLIIRNGGIGSFNKIFASLLAGNKRVKAEMLRSVLNDLCKAGAAHYFERSDTYMIKELL